MAELKPCKCGNKNLYIEAVKYKFLWKYIIVCLKDDCNNYKCVIKYGITYNIAEKRAIKAWNKLISKTS